MGDDGNDVLNGGLGADTLIGGAGNDVYYLDSAEDSITENADQGTDSVFSTVTYTLADNLEHLTLQGTIDLDGTGNALNNNITGNSGNNILIGGEGNDNLKAGLGADTLIGGAGNDTLYLGADSAIDTVLYNFGDGSDSIYQFNRTDGDKIGFTNINNIDVIVFGTTTSFRLSDGIGNNPGFGTGKVLVNLIGVSGLTGNNIGLNLAADNTANFLFA